MNYSQEEVWDFLMFEPKIAPEVIKVCTKIGAKRLIASLNEKKEAMDANMSALAETLEIIVLEVDPINYQKLKPELG